MITGRELYKKLEVAVEGHLTENQMLFDPIFRGYDGKYYLGCMVLDYAEGHRVKRSNKWFLFDIETVELVKEYAVSEYDYTNKEVLPLDMTFDADGVDLYKYSNIILGSYHRWKKEVIEEVKKQSEEDANKQEFKFMKIDDEYISPREYLLANGLPILDEVRDILISRVGDNIQKAHEDYSDYTFNKVRDGYLKNKTIDIDDNKAYLDFMNYLWPNLSLLIKAFDNINQKSTIM